MDTVYIVLVRWGPEWDGQSIYRTKSKALFDQICKADSDQDKIYFPSFSDELKTELRALHAQEAVDNPTLEPLDEEMSLTEAMEWLEYYSREFPVILAGETELTCNWNW